MTDAEWLTVGADSRTRCWWPGDAPDYVAYHDDEWGRPTTDDTRLFEKVCLEGFQSGLSWFTILRKRENFRAAFAGFDTAAVAAYGEADIDRLLGDAGIVRHRKKIESAINNAGRALEMADEFGSLAAYFWGWADQAATDTAEWERDTETPGNRVPPMPSTTPTSTALSKDLKRRGWSFVGPTTAYAFMQAMGLVNDHVEGCEWREVCAAEPRPAEPRPD